MDGVVLAGLFEEVRFQCIPEGDSGLFLRKNAEEGENPGEMLAPSSYESLFLPTLSIFCLITRLTF